MADSPESESCAIDGDDNLYGQGVRLGQYFLWFAFVIAYLHKQSKMRPIMINLAVFQLALTATMIWKVDTHVEEIFNIDIAIATHFTFLQSILLIMPIIKLIPGRGHISVFFMVFLFSVVYLTSAFNVWFWFVEIDNMTKPPCDAIFTFFFKKVSLNGWFMIVQKVMSAFIIAVLSLVLLTYISLILFCRRKMGLGGLLGLMRKKSSEKLEEDAAVGQYSWLVKLVLWITLVPSLVVMMTNLELSIKWNHIRNVNTLKSTGQTIPFIIGLVSLLDVLLGVLVPRKVNEPRSNDVTADDEMA